MVLAVWFPHPTVRVARKLSSIQRGFRLAITGAYRLTPTAALQVILEIPPLYLQLQLDARITELYRLRNKIPDIPHLNPEVLEHTVTGWTTHPSNHLLPYQISLDDGGLNNVGTRLYTDGSKSPNGVGAAFSVMQENNTTHQWSAKLTKDSTVFQADLLALNEAIK
ncbi:hypothetical protein AVEN_272894-1 [Araneus ventricosus]|uniref:Uncharacterized protein n=1 Tax=Araneus ventricosus TaxID=182803 RepID=A0A4Y2E7E6_ARAVE|nr:hypothetical protein AVEN_272894-1 [Araneus ventricosus]